MVLDERKLRILSAIIDDYIETAAPIGSRTITRRHDIGVSPATIRNEMSDLTELGYLEQPHVSAGRVPSGKAYRLYVDRLMAAMQDEDPTDEEVSSYFDEKALQMEDIVKTAVQAVSNLTHLTAVAVLPGQPAMRIATLQLVPMPGDSALLVIVTDSGIVRDTVIHVSRQLDMDALYAISRMLTENLAGHTLRDVQVMLDAYAARGGADQRVLMGVRDLAAQMAKQASEDSIAMEGAHNILNYPEFSDLEKARAFLSTLEIRDQLISLMCAGEQPISVRIGDELGRPDMADCSVVNACFNYGGCRGSLGVIGPMRMPYAQVIRTLYTISRRMTNLFAEVR